MSLPVTTLGIFDRKLLTVRIGTPPTLSSCILVIISSICNNKTRSYHFMVYQVWKISTTFCFIRYYLFWIHKTSYCILKTSVFVVYFFQEFNDSRFESPYVSKGAQNNGSCPIQNIFNRSCKSLTFLWHLQSSVWGKLHSRISMCAVPPSCIRKKYSFNPIPVPG